MRRACCDDENNDEDDDENNDEDDDENNDDDDDETNWYKRSSLAKFRSSVMMRESKFETVTWAQSSKNPEKKGGGGKGKKKNQKTNSRIELENSRTLRLSSF